MKRSSIEIAVGIFMIMGIACTGYLTIKLGKMDWMGKNYDMIRARFQSVAGLKDGAEVVIAGVKIGRIDKIDLDGESLEAVVTMKIQKGLRLTDDSIASVKTSGLIGDKYIKISPGGSDEFLKSGDMITETESAIDLEDLISKYVFGGV